MSPALLSSFYVLGRLCAYTPCPNSAVAAAIVQLYYLRTRASGSANFIYDLWVPVLCTQVVIALSIISACFPFLKSLIDALETGMVRIETRPANGAQHFGSSGGKQYSGSGGGYYRAQGSQFRQQPSTAGSPSSVPRNHSASPMNHSDVLRMDSLNLHGVGNVHQGNQLHGVATMASKADNDVDSQSSQAHILKKVEWSLTEENTGLPRA